MPANLGREEEIKDMVKKGVRKRIEVVRARQERTGVMFSNARKIDTPNLVLDTFGSLLEHAGVECLLVVAVTQKMEPIAVQLVGIGGVSQCEVSVAEVMKAGLLSNAPGIFLMHNHPSGDPTPSQADRTMTQRVEEACKIVGLQLFDHIIVGSAVRGYSLKKDMDILIGQKGA